MNSIIIRINSDGFKLYDLCCYVSLKHKYPNHKIIFTINDIDNPNTKKRIRTETNYINNKWHDDTFITNIAYYSDIDSLARIYFDRLIVLNKIKIKDNDEFICDDNPNYIIGKRTDVSILVYPIFYEMIIGYVNNSELSFGMYNNNLTDSEVNTIDNIVDILNFKHVKYLNMTDDMIKNSIGISSDLGLDIRNIEVDDSVKIILFLKSSSLLVRPIIHMILSAYSTTKYKNKHKNVELNTKFICEQLLKTLSMSPINISKKNMIYEDDFARVLSNPIPIILNNYTEFKDNDNYPECYPRKVEGMVYLHSDMKSVLETINDKSYSYETNDTITNTITNHVNIRLRYLGILSVRVIDGIYHGTFIQKKKKNKCKNKCNWLPVNCRLITINNIEYAIHDSLINDNYINIYTDGINQYIL